MGFGRWVINICFLLRSKILAFTQFKNNREAKRDVMRWLIIDDKALVDRQQRGSSQDMRNASLLARIVGQISGISVKLQPKYSSKS